MDRRSFIGVAVSALGLEITNMTGDDVPFTPVTPKLPATDFVAKISFGPDLILLACRSKNTDGTVKLETPWLECRTTGRSTPDRTSTLTVNNAVCPTAVMDEIVRRYGDLSKSMTNPPVTLHINESLVATLHPCFLRQIGYTAKTGELTCVADVSLDCVWVELKEAADKYRDARQKEIDEEAKRNPPRTEDAEAAETEAEYAYRDSAAYYEVDGTE